MGLAAVHAASGLWMWSSGDAGLLEAVAGGRSIPFRVAVGGQYGPLVRGGEWWRLCTSVLLHADGLHLLVNGVALVALGRLLEPWVGSVRWLAWFALGGLGGSLLSHASGVLQSDGASGGAFALLGAAVVLGWRSRAQLEPEDRRLYGPILWGFLILNLVLSLVLPFVDAAGHVGGLMVGLLAGWLPGHRAVRSVEIVALLTFAAVCGLGWATGAG